MIALLSWLHPPGLPGELMGDAAGRFFESVMTEASALQLSINIARIFHESIPQY